ncbi:MAG: hypothetical protein KF684_02705 [Phycisphaeraceae bacterium]|nr:hypothetical protein [Phycisphaeraceae bacterium]
MTTQHVDEDVSFLKKELILRMTLQNLVLIILMPLLMLSFVLGIDRPAFAAWIALAYVIASGMGALYWAHSGARTVQIAAFIRLQEDKRGHAGWETWLKANPFPRPLGSRWTISTKGVFLGSQLLVITLVGVVLDSGPVNWPVVGGAIAGMIGTALILPHPRLPGHDEHA